MKRKLIAIMLALIVLVGVLGGCGGKQVSQNGDTKDTSTSAGNGKDPAYFSEVGFKKEGYPIVDKKVNVSLFGLTHATLLGAKEDWEKNLFWTRLEEKTNVHFDFTKIVNGGKTWREQMNLTMASGDYPDVFFKSNFIKQDELLYGENGAFIPLENLIKDYAPNLAKLMQDNPDIRKDITTPSGHIYTLPGIVLNKNQCVASNIMINKVWLDKLGLKEPTSVEEYYNVLKAFKEQDPNGNKKADEIPLSLAGIMEVKQMVRMWGLLGKDNDLMFADEKAKKVLYIPLQPEFKEYLKFMKKLYAEGLLDPESFTMNGDQRKAKGSEADSRIGSAITNSMGLVVGGNSQLKPGVDRVKDPTAMRDEDYMFITPFKAANGRQLALAESVTNSGKVAITNKCKNPEVVIRWMDYLYTQEGGMYMWGGLEGSEWKKSADGKFEFILKPGESDNDLRKRATMQPGGNQPGLFPDLWLNTDYPTTTRLVKNRAKLEPYIATPTPAFYIETSKNKEVTAIQADITPYVEQFVANVITGKVDMNAEWSNFESTLKRMGIDRMIEINQKAYEEYLKN